MTNNQMESDFPPVLTQEILVLLIILALEALVCFVGNAILLRSLFLYRNVRVDLYVILGGMAIADIFHMLIIVPYQYIEYLQAFELVTTPWCKASKYLLNSTSYIAAYHMVILAVLRGILLTNRDPNSPTGHHALYCSIVVWVIGALATVPVTQVFTVFDGGYCEISMDADRNKERWLTASFSCFVPISIVLLIYGTTYYIGKRYFADSYSRHERQMSCLVSVVMSCFVVCEVPYNVVSLMLINDNLDPKTSDTLFITSDYCLCLLLLDKAIRPVLYSKLSSELGKYFDEVVNCTYCHRYYSDSPKREEADNVNANSRAPLTSGAQAVEMTQEEVV